MKDTMSMNDLAEVPRLFPSPAGTHLAAPQGIVMKIVIARAPAIKTVPDRKSQ